MALAEGPKNLLFCVALGTSVLVAKLPSGDTKTPSSAVTHENRAVGLEGHKDTRLGQVWAHSHHSCQSYVTDITLPLHALCLLFPGHSHQQQCPGRTQKLLCPVSGNSVSAYL